VAVPVATAHRFVRGHLLVNGANCEAAVDRGLPLLACATPPRHDRASAQMTTAHRCGAPAKDEESRAVTGSLQQHNKHYADPPRSFDGSPTIPATFLLPTFAAFYFLAH